MVINRRSLMLMLAAVSAWCSRVARAAGTTWNPSDKTASATLSNGNLTVTFSSTGGVRSVSTVGKDKWYWEVQFTSGSSPVIGVSNATAVLATVYATPTNAAVAYNGSTYVNNVSQAGAGITIVVGATVCIALDVDAKLIWFRAGAAGNWNNSGTANPATGVGGLNITVLGTPLYALVATNGAPTYNANFGNSAFIGAVPAGFTAGLSSASTATAVGTLSLGIN